MQAGHVHRRPFVLSCCVALVLVNASACGEDGSRLTDPVAKIERTAAPTFTSEELLLGLIFRDGPAVQSLPNISKSDWLSSKIKDPHKLAVQREIIGRIATNASERFPDAMKEFSRRVTSGNPSDVESGLGLGRLTVLASLYTLEEVVTAREELAKDSLARNDAVQYMRQLVAAKPSKDDVPGSEDRDKIIKLVAVYLDLQLNPQGDTTNTTGHEPSRVASENGSCIVVGVVFAFVIEVFFEIMYVAQLVAIEHLGIAVQMAVAFQAMVGYETLVAWENGLLVDNQIALSNEFFLWNERYFFSGDDPSSPGIFSLKAPSPCKDDHCDAARQLRPPGAVRADMAISSMTQALRGKLRK